MSQYIYAVALRCYNCAQGEVEENSGVWLPKLLEEDEQERRLNCSAQKGVPEAVV